MARDGEQGGRSSPERHGPSREFKQEHRCLYFQLKPAVRDWLRLAHRPPSRLRAACYSEEPGSARLVTRAPHPSAPVAPRPWPPDRLPEHIFARRVRIHGVKEIIEEAECLPVEERVMVIDSLLRTINPPLAGVEGEWLDVARRRLIELRSGQVDAVPGNEVFAKISGRFGT